VQNRTKSGLLRPHSQGKRGKLYDLDQAGAAIRATEGLAELSDRGKLARHTPPAQGAPDIYAELVKERTAKERAQREKIERENRVRSGELIERDTVRAQVAEVGTVINSTMDTWPARLAAEFAAMGKAGADAHDFSMRLDAEVQALKQDIRDATSALPYGAG
jgi:phage terminase Nu1 subunit (DNA packaging protein)